MMTVAFDTLKLATKLEEAGFTPAQAKGASSAIADALTGEIATKNDLDRVETSLKTEIAALDSKIDKVEASLIARIDKGEASLKSIFDSRQADIYKWMFGQTIVILGAVLALSRFGH